MKAKEFNRDLLHKALDAVLDACGYASISFANVTGYVCIAADKEAGTSNKDFDLMKMCFDDESLAEAIKFVESMGDSNENDHT